MLNDLQIFVQPVLGTSSLDVYINNGAAWVTEVVVQTKNDYEIPPRAFQLSGSRAQSLMDRLWQAGVRPTEGKGSAGALAATERHLEDMRRLVLTRGE